MIFQHNGAPPHYTREVKNFFNQTYSCWIGGDGKLRWPPSSPDLTPPDFFLWGHIKEQVYKDNVSNITHLKQKITEEFEKLKNDISLYSVQMSLIRRANLCMQQRGGHFQQCL